MTESLTAHTGAHSLCSSSCRFGNERCNGRCAVSVRLCLQQIFKLYKASGDRTHHLKGMCDALDQSEYLCLKHPISVRWLSLGKAVKAVKNMHPALALELEEEEQRNNLTAAVNLSRKCKMFAFIAMTYMLSDIIPLMEKLNLMFQREAVNL